MRLKSRAATLGALAALGALGGSAGTAQATPVCTDGYRGGPALAACGNRIFPEAHNAQAYIQWTADPLAFVEYKHGVEYLTVKYPRYASLTTLRDIYGSEAVSAGPDKIRAGQPGDTGDGRDVHVIKITDHSVADKKKRALYFSLSVHGNERGGLEGGVRTAEDLAMAATNGGRIVDGYDNFESTTGQDPKLRSYNVRELLKKQVLYLVDFNTDGWAVGDIFASPFTGLYARGNSIGTDLNRQMPTEGRINPSRNPLQENEMKYGRKHMDDIAAAQPGGRFAYGADIHGELTSQAFMDIMYPAGEFDSVDHRRLMAMAERTKSVVDKTLFGGLVDLVEAADGGDQAEGSGKDTTTGLASVPTKPAHWATVWDTLGYTDTGFIGDYLASEVGVTGMDYEIFLNHTVPDKNWNVVLQANHINATRAIIKTAMAYAMTQEKDFNEDTVQVETEGQAGYVKNPDTVTDKDEDGVGTLPGPRADGIGADGKPVAQASYEATNQRFFQDQNRLVTHGLKGVDADDIAKSARALDALDSLVIADVAVPAGSNGKPVDEGDYWANIKSWVEKGGNLVLTDGALHGLAQLDVVDAAAVKDIRVYQPYANFRDFGHPLADGIRENGRQLVEAAILGYGIGNSASPMTIVDKAAWTAAKGVTVATTGNNTGSSDPQAQTSIGEVKLGKGKVRILGGALPMPTEENDHRFGLKDYGLTYTGLFAFENAIRHDAAGLGKGD